MTDTLGVVIPAYEPDVDALTRYLRGIDAQLSPAVIRVEIDSPQADQLSALDATAAELDATPVEINAVDRRRGKGGAITEGFDSLGTEVLAFADADGSVPAASLADVVDPTRRGETALSVGSRRHPDAVIVDHQTVGRRLLGDAFAAVARQLLPTRCYDYQCGAKALRAAAWSDIRHYCYERGFAWDLEVLSVADALGYGISEVPVTWEDHPDSTVDPIPTAVELGRALVAIRSRTGGLTPRDRVRSVDRATALTNDGN